MKGFLAALTLAVSLCGCATLSQPASDYMSLQVDSYNPESGEFRLTLRNNSPRDVMFLHYLVTFSPDRPTALTGRPTFPPNDSVMLHDTRLEPGNTFQIVGTCSSSGWCRESAYAGIYACWFNAGWECKEYSRVWSESPVNGP